MFNHKDLRITARQKNFPRKTVTENVIFRDSNIFSKMKQYIQKIRFQNWQFLQINPNLEGKPDSLGLTKKKTFDRKNRSQPKYYCCCLATVLLVICLMFTTLSRFKFSIHACLPCLPCMSFNLTFLPSTVTLHGTCTVYCHPCLQCLQCKPPGQRGRKVEQKRIEQNRVYLFSFPTIKFIYIAGTAAGHYCLFYFLHFIIQVQYSTVFKHIIKTMMCTHQRSSWKHK